MPSVPHVPEFWDFPEDCPFRKSDFNEKDPKQKEH
jgi:hypothetical protein